MTEAMKRRLFGLGAVAIAGSALAYISLADLGENLVYYWSPTELIQNAQAEDALVRLGGMVVPGSLTWDRDAQHATFAITDGQNQVPVQCKGNPPQMFREGIGVVVEGRLQADGIFHTERVMVKHSNEYRAPEDGENPSDVYKTLVAEEP
jgi:cytochrome c-type biogenesis protein CcmE